MGLAAHETTWLATRSVRGLAAHETTWLATRSVRGLAAQETTWIPPRTVWVLARLEIESGQSGNGLRCLEPGQNFRKFNSDHFPFFKNLNPTSGSRVSLPAPKNT